MLLSNRCSYARFLRTSTFTKWCNEINVSKRKFAETSVIHSQNEPDYVARFRNCNLYRFREHNNIILTATNEIRIDDGDCVAVIGTASAGKTFFLEAISGEHGVKSSSQDDVTTETDVYFRSWKWLHRNMRRVSFQETSQFGYGEITGAGFAQQRFESQGDTTTLTIGKFFQGLSQIVLEGNFDESLMPKTPRRKLDEEKQHQITIDRYYSTTGLTSDTTMAKLSNGQLRRARLIASILDNPLLLLLDEPFMGLDRNNQRECARMIYDEYLSTHSFDKGAKKTLVIGLRPQDHVPSYVNKVIVLGNRHIVACYSREKFDSIMKQLDSRNNICNIGSDLFLTISKDKYEKKHELTSASSTTEFILNSCLWSHHSTNHNSDKVISDLKKAAVPEMDTVNSSNLPVVEFNDVSVSYYGNKKLHDIDWTVRKGERWVLWGGNGSGKSTLLSLMVGEHPQVFCNDIKLFGKPRGTGETIFDIKTRCLISSPELHFYFRRDLTVEQAIATRFAFSQPPIEKENIKRLVNGVLTDFGLNTSKFKERTFRSLSSAEQRLVLFLRAVVGEPELVLLDEPFQGLDTAVINTCCEWLNKNLTKDQSLIIVTHSPDEIPPFMKKIMILKEGHVAAQGIISTEIDKIYN